MTKAEHRHEQDRDDDLLKAPREGDDPPTEIVDGRRGEIVSGTEGHRHGDRNTDGGRDDRHRQALDQTVLDVFPATDEVRLGKGLDESPAAVESFPDTPPIDLDGAKRSREIDCECDTQPPTQTRIGDDWAATPGP